MEKLIADMESKQSQAYQYTCCDKWLGIDV